MAVARVGSAQTSTSTSATLTATLPNTATAGNLLIVTVHLSASTTTSPNPTCTTPSGWTLANTGGLAVNVSNSRAGVWIFYKVAAGSDSAPAFSVTYPNGGGIAIAEEWSGLDTTTPLRGVGAGATNSGTSQTNITLTDSIAVTTGDLVISAGSCRSSSNANLSYTWGGGDSTEVAKQTLGTTVNGGTGSQTAASTTTIAPTLNLVQSSGSLTGAVMISAAFIPSATSGATVALPVMTVATAAPAPTVATGVTVALPVAAVALAAPAPTLAGGATVALPLVALATAAPAPTVTTGVTLALPVINVDIAAPAPTVTGTSASGASVTLPVLAVVLAAPAPTVTGSATVALPVMAVATAAPAPTVTAGSSGDATVTLAAVPVTVGAYTFTTHSSVNVGLPVIKTKIVAPAGWYGTEKPLDRIHVTLFDADGLTRVAGLDNARNQSWQEWINQPGSATFEVPLDDAGPIQSGMIVKLGWYRDGIRVADFACRVQGETMQYAVDGRRWLRFENQPGALSLLSDAVIFPEYGYDGFGIEKRQTGTDRHMGYMSASGGAWFIDSNWVTPRSRPWGTGTRKKQPADFRAFDSTAEWCSIHDPDTSQAADAVVYGRDAFFTDGPCDVQIVASFDDLGDLWVDGEQLITGDRTEHNAWTQAQTVTARVSGGEHVLAVLAKNAPYVTGHPNPVAFIYSVRQLDDKGNPTGPVLTNSKPASCLVNDGTPEPAYRKAQALLRLFAEAEDRGVIGVQSLQHGWTDEHDTNGAAWTDLTALVFPIGTVSLLDVFTQLCEQGMDMRIDPSTMTLQLFKRLGTDKSGSVQLQMGADGGNLMSFEMPSSPPGFTSILTQLATGEWVRTEDAAGVAAHGLIESGATVGSVDSPTSATGVAGKLLDESAHPLASMTAESSLTFGLIPYVHYDLGDTIAVPGRRNSGTLNARVMSFTVDGSADIVKVTTELVEDRT